jgi:hypothetical protein
MPEKRAKATGFIFQGNPTKWRQTGGMSSDVAHKSGYIYWSTPECRNEVQRGDKAYIWRALGEGPRGIIAAGIVEERPRQFLEDTKSLFKHPERLGPGEEAASSNWKTGISISEYRLTSETGMLTAESLKTVSPDLGIIKAPRGRTVFRLNAQECQEIEALWERSSKSAGAHKHP